MGSGSLHAQVFATIDYPGASASGAVGIDGGTIVGWQRTPGPGGATHGYVYQGGGFSELRYRGSSTTKPKDVSGNRIVGQHQDPTTHLDASFIYDNGSWSTLANPAYTYTFAEGVDGDKVVGWMTSGPGSGTGFIYDGAWTPISVPGSASTRLYGIEGANLVGAYTDSSFNSHGFLYDGAHWTTLDFPGGSSTQPLDVSGNNIVGTYTDAGGASRGFRYDGRFWNTIGIPGSTSSADNGIDGQIIVGEYAQAGVTHGFSALASPAPAEYKFAFHGEVTAVNDAGNRFNGAFQVGDPVDGTYNYFDQRYQEGVDMSGSSKTFQYFFALGGSGNFFNRDPSPVSLELEIGDHAYESGRNTTAASDYSLRVTNDADGATPPSRVGDEYRLQSQLQIPGNFNNVANVDLLTSFALYDETGTALSSKEFPRSAPEVAKFASRIGRISLIDKFSFQLLASVEYRIDALTAVPEPSSLALVAVGLCGASLAGRNAGRRNQRGLPETPPTT